MGIGIGINVDARQLKEARREVEVLNTALTKTADSDINIGVDNSELADTAAILAKLREEVSRMGELSRSSTNRGGLLRKEQFVEAGELAKKVQGGFGKWTDEINKARQALKNLMSERKDLQYTMGQVMAGKDRLSPSQINSVTDRLEAVDVEEKAARARIANLQKNNERVNQFEDMARRHSGVLGGAGLEPDRQTLNVGIGLKKALGWGLAAAGGFSLLGFMGQSRSAYRSAIEEEGPLYARGMRGARSRAERATSLGITPGEYYAFEDTLSRSTGLNEKTGIARHAMFSAAFSKASGLGLDEVANLRGGIYQATGNASSLPNSVLIALSRAHKDGIDKSRLPELLTLVNRNTAETAKNMGGAGMSGAQMATAFNMATMGIKEHGTFAKSGEFYGMMQNGLKGAGTPAGEIMLWDALGGFDGGMNFEKIHKMNLVKQGGFLENPGLLQNIMGRITGSKGERAGKLESFFTDWGINGKAADTLVAMQDSGFLSTLAASKGTNIEQMAKNGDKEALKWLAEIKANPVLGRQSIEAAKDLVKIEAGDKLSKLFEPMEMAAAKFAGAILNKDWQQSFSIFSKAAGDMGPISKTLLAAGGLYAAGGAMSFMGGAMGMRGKAGAIFPALMGPTGILAALGIGYGATYAAFKDGAAGGNYLPEYRKNALTGKGFAGDTAFAGKLNRTISNSANFSQGYKDHAVELYVAAKKYGVPENLLAGLIDSESGFVNVSPRQIKLKGGKTTTVGGISQFTEETAKAYKIDRMNPGQAIDGSAHYLSDLYKQTGDWREAVKRYKGVESQGNMWQVDTAMKKAEAYTKNESERQTLQKTTSTDTTLQLLVDILQVIAGHSEQTALNTGAKPITAAPLAIR